MVTYKLFIKNDKYGVTIYTTSSLEDDGLILHFTDKFGKELYISRRQLLKKELVPE